MKKKYRREMDYVYAVINEMRRKLDRPIRDLDDVRMIMDTLKKIREQEVDMELKVEPIEVLLIINKFTITLKLKMFINKAIFQLLQIKTLNNYCIEFPIKLLNSFLYVFRKHLMC